jgi:hypothetical protein
MSGSSAILFVGYIQGFVQAVAFVTLRAYFGPDDANDTDYT